MPPLSDWIKLLAGVAIIAILFYIITTLGAQNGY